MKLFLTSEIGATVKIDGKRCPGKLDNRYGFLDLFQQALRKTERMLYVSAYVDDNLRVSEWYANTIESLKKEKIEFQESTLINGRNVHLLERMLPDTDVVFLSGGHLPTQNRFFASIHLKQLLQSYQGIVVAQSAGSMNCASTVYICPELPGEATDPHFQRSLPGLGLTDLNIIPHVNVNRFAVLDGMKLYDEIVAPDTFQRPLYLLADGSFFYIRDHQPPVAYGEIYLFDQGQITVFSPGSIHGR